MIPTDPFALRSTEHQNDSMVSVLLADSDSTLSATLDALFSAHAAQPITLVGATPSSEGFLALAQTLAPMVVLIDLHLPKFGGLWTIPLLRVYFPEIGVIVLVPEDKSEYRSAVHMVGGDATVLRSTVQTDLIPAIERILSQSV